MLFLLSLVVRVLARLLVLSGADEATKDLEILVLRQQLCVLRRQAGRPRFTALDRVLLAAASRALPSSTPSGRTPADSRSQRLAVVKALTWENRNGPSGKAVRVASYFRRSGRCNGVLLESRTGIRIR